MQDKNVLSENLSALKAKIENELDVLKSSNSMNSKMFTWKARRVKSANL